MNKKKLITDCIDILSNYSGNLVDEERVKIRLMIMTFKTELEFTEADQAFDQPHWKITDAGRLESFLRTLEIYY